MKSTCISLAFCCWPLFSSAFAKDQKAKADKTALDNLQGSWTAVNARRLDLHRMIFKGDKIILVFSESLKNEYLVTVNAKPKPAHIDVLHNKEKSLGIYELDRDTLRICMGPWLGPRPTDFKSKGKNVVLVTLMREEKCNLSDALLAAGVSKGQLDLESGVAICPPFAHPCPCEPSLARGTRQWRRFRVLYCATKE